MRSTVGVAAAVAVAVLVTGCGGAKRDYTYNLADKNGSGLYLTVISPVQLPPSAFRGARLVQQVTGREDCAFTQTVKNPPHKYAAFEGKKLTLKVYGKSSFSTLICSAAKQAPLTQILKP